MSQNEMMPTLNMQEYIPPLTKPSHQIEPMMKQLMEREQEFHKSNQEMAANLQQLASSTMQRMKRPGAMTFLPREM